MRIGKSLIPASLFTLLLAASLPAWVGSLPSLTGRVLAIEISANGLKSQSKRYVRQSRTDIWWTYTLCTENRTFYAVSRLTPVKTGLTVDSGIKFTASKSRIYFLDPGGKQQFLRIIRQEKGKGCSK